MGGALDSYVSARNHHYAAGQREWFVDALVAFAATGQWVYELGPGELSQTLTVPLASLALRTPYPGAKFVPSPEVRGPGTLLGLSYQAGYARALSPALTLVTSYRLRVLSYPDPRPFTVLAHHLAVGLELGL